MSRASMAAWLKSLRLRLLGGILLTLLAAVGASYAWYRNDVTRERTGAWDAELQSAAQMALMSLPQGLEDTALPQGYASPVPMPLNGDPTLVGVQVWGLRDHRLLLRSPGAPADMLSPLMEDGFDYTAIDGKEWRVYAISDAEGRIQVQVGKPMSQLDQELGARLRKGLLMMWLLFAMLAGVAWIVVRQALSPMLRVSEAIRGRHALDLHPLPTDDLPSEFRPLVDAFNQQLGRLDAAVQNERRFIVDAAHELRTPLAVLSMQTENALSAGSLDEVRAVLRKLLDAIQRSARLSAQLLDMARMDADVSGPGAATFDLRTVLRMTVRDFEVAAAQRGQTLLLDVEPCWISGDIDALGILVRNLLDNAVRYSGQGSRIEASCREDQEDPADPGVVLRIADDGPGVSETERQRIFDRFYRIPGTSEYGSGIGLSLVERIAALHGAAIEVGTGLGGAGLGVRLKFRRPHAEAGSRHDG